MSDTKPITGELRKYATVSWDPWPDARDRLYQMCDRIDAIHAGLEREYAATLAEREGDWIKLPVDADGLPIHVGDVMEWALVEDDGLTIVREVSAVGDGVFFAWSDEQRRYVQYESHVYRHCRPDTWESIIDDAEALAREWFNTDMSENEHADGLNALVARCKKLAGEAE